MVQIYTAEGMREVVDAWLSAPRDPQRWNAPKPCRKCGQKTSALGQRVQVRVTVVRGKIVGGWCDALLVDGGRLFLAENGFCYLPCRGGCGRTRVAVRVDGTYNPGKVCNAKCMGATGHVCDCRCGGKLHGASFSL